MKKLELIVHGKNVVDEDYRPFLLEEAFYLDIKGFSATNYLNNDKQMIKVKLEGSFDQLEEFIHNIRSNFPERAEVEEIEEKCIDTHVSNIDKFLMYMECELWHRFAEAASGNEIGSRHFVIGKNKSIR
jgi:acylphosphatase